MRIAEYKQTGTRTEEYTVIIPPEYDDEGMVITEEHKEVRTREVPVMGLVYRDMTEEEIQQEEERYRASMDASTGDVYGTDNRYIIGK